MFAVLARGRKIAGAGAHVAAVPFVGYAPPAIDRCNSTMGASSVSLIGVASGSRSTPIVASLSSGFPMPHLDLRVVVSAADRRVYPVQHVDVNHSAFVSTNRFSKRQRVGGVKSHIHRVSVDFNLVPRDGEMDDNCNYTCPHCGCEITGSLLLRAHLLNQHAQIRR